MKKIILLFLLLMIATNWSYADIITEISVTDETEMEFSGEDQEDVMGEEDAMAEPELLQELNKLSLAGLTALAGKDNPAALLTLGDRYYYGKGGAGRDRAQALKWYLKAAELGCTASQFNLGHMYRNGTGTKQNMQKALEWFEQAAYFGDTEAQFMAAEMHSTGSGVPQNNIRAYMWYKIAYTTMEQRFRSIAKTELDMLKTKISKAEIAKAEELVLEWHNAQVARIQKAQQN